jgi:hypothetical protein
MNLRELDSFKISDAITFHNELNPKLWRNNHLRPEVKKQLELVAQDFLSELGVHDLEVQDLTVSGSNAAYSYTPHSDLDLHILIDMSRLENDDIYRELFHAKKIIYNDTHNILIHGVPVEIYVQDAREPVVSLGEYSIKDNKWLRIPTKRRANFDQTATRAKYDKLLELVQFALTSSKLKKIENIIKKIKQYRKAGLDKGGEFGPENLAYKALRSQGYIDKLYALRDKLHSEHLTIETMYQDPIKVQEDNLAEKFAREFNQQEVDEARANPEQNYRYGSGKYELASYAEGIRDKSNWGVSMTLLPKLGINPQPSVSEDTPKGIYFYPLDYFLRMLDNKKRLPWGDHLPYMQLLQFDTSHMMTPNTKVPFEDMKRVLAEYGITDSDIQYAIDEPSMSARKGINDALWFTYDALSRRFKNDERKIIVWNKILRNLGFTVLLDEGKSWIAFGEPYQGCILDPRAIKQHKTFNNYVQGDKLSMKRLSDALYWSISHLRVNSDTRQKLSNQVAKEMLSQFLGMTRQEAKQNGYDDALKKAVDKVEKLSKETLSEAFDKPYPFTWEKSDFGDYDALATLDDGTLLSIMIEPEGDDEWHVRFDRNFSMGVTGEGDAQRVFATVISAIHQFIQKEHPWRLIFSASKDPNDAKNSESRAKLYNSLIRRYARAWGYDEYSEDHGDQVVYELTRLKQGVAEAESTPQFVYHVTPTRNLKSIAKQGLKPTVGDRTSQIAGEKSGIYVFPDRTSAEDAVMNWLGDEFDDEPLTMLKIDVSGLEKNISKGADYELIVDTIIDPSRIKKVNIQLEEASGYIPSYAERNDPRFKTALTVDVHPDSIKKNAKAFYWKTSRAGIPPNANPNGKY